MLYKEDVWSELQGKTNFENYTIEMCENDLTGLVNWGNLTALQDMNNVKCKKRLLIVNEWNGKTNGIYFKEEIITKNESKNQIYYKLKKYYNKNKEELKTALVNASKGINELPQNKTRIPVYASNITGNPHGFDKNTICGKIFITLICYMKKIQYPQNTEELAEIYYNNNLLIDDVSNMVLCKMY